MDEMGFARRVRCYHCLQRARQRVCGGEGVPYVYWRSVYKKRYLIRQLEEAQLLNGMLQERQRKETRQQPQQQSEVTADNDDIITISGATRESLEVSPSQVVYATSEGNYVRIHYYNNDSIQSMSIRTSMKNVSELLCSQSYIMQCHRAFIVNLNFVISVSDRNSGYQLQVFGTDKMIPMSRNNTSAVKEKLRN